MTTDTKVAELPAKWRAWAKRIRGITAGSDLAADIMEGSAEDLEAALARQEADKMDIMAHRLLYLDHSGEWVTHGRPWVDGRPDPKLLTELVEPNSRWRIEYAYAAPHSAPVGQEPVCSISPYDLAKLQKHETARVRPPGQGVPLYAAQPAAQAVDLPDDFSESKDWRESNYNGRVDWLKAMHASQRAEIVRLQNDVEILRALIDQQAGKGGA